MEERKTAWITGASSGLGLSIARAFAEAGWLVIAGARSFEDAPEHQNLVRLKLDVEDEASCERFAGLAMRLSPRVDALVAAAAVLVLGSCERTGVDEYRRVMDTNFLGAVRMVRRALPAMRRQAQGRIMLMSSVNGLLGIPFQSAYTASKHALEGYAECLAMETQPFGVQVCLVEPGDHRGGSRRTRLTACREDEASPYRDAFDRACAAIRRDEDNGLDPDRLGRKVLANVLRPRMRFRLCVAKPDQRLATVLHDVCPARLFFSILNGYYRGGKPNENA